MSKQPLTITEVWFTSLRSYRDTFTQVWFLPAIIGILINVLFVLNQLHPLSTDASIMTGVLYIVIVLVAQLLNIYLVAVVLHRINAINEQQNIPLSDSLLLVNKRYCKIFICDFFIRLLFLLGVFALVLPGIYVFIIFWMAQPLILFENKKVIAALRGSFKLIHGSWWQTFAIFLPVVIIFYLTALVTSILILRYTTAWYITASIGVLFTIIFSPLFNAFTLVQYNNLKSCAIISDKA